MSAGRVVDLPASATREDGRTAILVQHPEDGIEDGHEIAFQSGAARHQARCFLSSLRPGPPTVPAGQGWDAPCP